MALDAFDAFGFPKIPDPALRILEKMNGQIRLSIITSSEGFVRLGILVPKPNLEVNNLSLSYNFLYDLPCLYT